MNSLDDFFNMTIPFRFKPKYLWESDEILHPEWDKQTRNILRGAKWKAVPAKPDKPYGICTYITKRGRIVLQYNPAFMDRLMNDYEWLRSTVLHEVMHVLFGHLTYRLPYGVDMYRWNVACDLAINDLLARAGSGYDRIPPMFLVPGKGRYASFPHQKTSEEYYEMVKDQNLPKDDKHKFLKRNDTKRFRVVGAMTKMEEHCAQQELFQKSHNTVRMDSTYNQYAYPDGHGECENGEFPALESLLLRITQLHQGELVSSRRVYNRRYAEYPGKRKEKEPDPIVVLADWSPSMNEEEHKRLGHFLSLLNREFPLVVVPFHTQARMDLMVKFGKGKFSSLAHQRLVGTEVDTSIQQIYQAFPRRDQIIVVASDFNDATQVSEVRKNVFGVSVGAQRYANYHEKFKGKMYKM